VIRDNLIDLIMIKKKYDSSMVKMIVMIKEWKIREEVL